MRASAAGILVVLGMGFIAAAYVRGYRPEVVRVRSARVQNLVHSPSPAARALGKTDPAPPTVAPAVVTTTTIPVFAGSSVTALYQAPVADILPQHYPLAGNGPSRYQAAEYSVAFQLQGAIGGGEFVLKMDSGPGEVVVAAARNGRVMMAAAWPGAVTLTNLSGEDAVFCETSGSRSVQWLTVNLLTGVVRESALMPFIAEDSTNIAGIAGTYPAPVIRPLSTDSAQTPS